MIPRTGETTTLRVISSAGSDAGGLVITPGAVSSKTPTLLSLSTAEIEPRFSREWCGGWAYHGAGVDPLHPPLHLPDECRTDPTHEGGAMNLSDLQPAGTAALAACRSALDPQTLRPSVVLGADVPAAMQEEHERLGRPVLVEGARGHVTGHPLLGEMRRQAAHLAELARSLGLTRPGERSMVGRNIRAPDRLAQQRARRAS